jgi:hypothetical protein
VKGSLGMVPFQGETKVRSPAERGVLLQPAQCASFLRAGQPKRPPATRGREGSLAIHFMPISRRRNEPSSQCCSGGTRTCTSLAASQSKAGNRAGPRAGGEGGRGVQILRAQSNPSGNRDGTTGRWCVRGGGGANSARAIQSILRLPPVHHPCTKVAVPTLQHCKVCMQCKLVGLRATLQTCNAGARADLGNTRCDVGQPGTLLRWHTGPTVPWSSNSRQCQ